MPPLIEVRNLTIQFETDGGLLTAVENVSFDIAAGETLGVVGESGSGKSVTSLAILGLLPHSRSRISGSILARFDGSEPIELIGAPPELYRKLRGNRMAMIFQEPMTSLNPVLRVGDQIAEAIRLHRQMSPNEAKERAIAMLDTVGIPEARMRARAYPHQLSGGMCQRVMIAMALSCEPQLLIADEPTTALDVTIQAQVLELISSLQEKFGMSVLFISHDLGVVADMADRVAVMYSGRIVEQADARTIIQRSQHPYSRGLLNSIPRIEGTKHRLKPIRGMLPDGRRRLPGCAFAPRCDYVIPERCAVTGAAQTLYKCGEAQGVRCERLGEIWPLGTEVA